MTPSAPSGSSKSSVCSTLSSQLRGCERLVLRAHQRADFESFAAHSADVEVTRFMGGALDRRGAWRFFLIGAGGWAVTGADWWTFTRALPMRWRGADTSA